jgi:radical SAM superfamily enzyme YgiQ (UPF0313 family)
MKKLLLVNTNMVKSPYPIPPLGICLIASCLQGRFNVRIYDGMFDEGRGLEAELRGFKPDFVGFSIRNVDNMVPDRSIYFVKDAYLKFIEPARRYTDVPFILGGSGFTIFPREIMDYTGADYGITGEGEETLMLLLRNIERGEDVSKIPNVYTKSGQGPVLLRVEEDYNLRPFSLIDLKIDFKPYTGRGVYSIQTKRGCALQCLYCSYPVLEGKQYRLRAPSSIADEIEQASERIGPDITFEFVDSTFNEPKAHAEAICRELIRRKIKVRMRTMGVNPRHTSRELFALMTEAGFAQIDVTPDSASPSVIRNLCKGFTMDDICRTANLIREFDIPSMWFFLFGGPGENRKTFNETLSFIDHYINPDDLVYMSGGLRIYPGTPLYTTALDEGIISASDNLLDPSVFYFSKDAPQEQLREWTLDACKLRLNCLPSAETTPPAEMLREAVLMRNASGLTEPMFRTLMRIRREWKANGKLKSTGIY